MPELSSRTRLDTLAVRLNRIARCLRNRDASEDPRNFAERMAGDIEQALYEVSPANDKGDRGEWEHRFNIELRTNPDALLDWWRNGFRD